MKTGVSSIVALSLMGCSFHSNQSLSPCHPIDMGDTNRDGKSDVICMDNEETESPIVVLGSAKDGFKRVIHEAVPIAAPTTVPDDTGFNTEDYTVGPGDTLEIKLWKQTDVETHEVTIRTDGKISLLLIEDFFVQGLTLAQLDEALTTRLSKYYVSPKVDVTVKEYGYQKVALFGAIQTLSGTTAKSGPGIYTLKRPTRILELLTEAGGLKTTADQEEVIITRKEGAIIKLNLNLAYADIHSRYNLFLHPGDTIFVQDILDSFHKIFVMGEVNTPGQYPIRRDGTLLDILPLVGGFKPFANPGKAKLIRKLDKSKGAFKEISVNIKKLLEGDYTLNVTLEDGDILVIP